MLHTFHRVGKYVALALFGVIAAPDAVLAASPWVAASNSVVLSSEAFIERVEAGADGKERAVLKQPKDVIVVPGDKVVFTLRYANKGAEPAAGFRATNPMPGPVQFVSVAEEWAEVSIDKGATWGQLSDMKVIVKGVDGAPDSMRAAGPEDVTHVRWVFSKPIAPGTEGTVSYRGLVK